MTQNRAGGVNQPVRGMNKGDGPPRSAAGAPRADGHRNKVGTRAALAPAPSARPTALFVANRGFALTGGRLVLMRHLVRCGWHVVAAVSPDAHVREIAQAGVDVQPVHFARRRWAAWRDVQSYRRLAWLHRYYRPALAHHFNAKPIVLGSAAVPRAARTVVIHTVTGLGHAFIAGGPLRCALSAGYRSAARRADLVVFQNGADRDLFVHHGWIAAERTWRIAGAGVDTRRFRPVSRDNAGAPVVLMASRLRWQKGVREFVRAAAACKAFFPQAQFLLAGPPDTRHPDAVPATWVDQLRRDGVVQYLGHLDRIDAVLPQVDLVVLPSYREGMPRVLLEAAACGTPAITTDVPGCRDAVLHGETGWLVPPRDATALAHAIHGLLADRCRRRELGRNARRRAVALFDADAIAERHFAAYRAAGCSRLFFSPGQAA